MEESILFSVGSSLGIRTASILVSATNFDGSVSKRNSADVYPTDSIQKPILSAIEALAPYHPAGQGLISLRDIKTAPCRRHGAVLLYHISPPYSRRYSSSSSASRSSRA